MTPQNSTSVASASDSVDDLDEQLAYQISQAWSENKDASGVVTFQVNGEIALSQGDREQARRDFEAAEQELAHLKPVLVRRP